MQMSLEKMQEEARLSQGSLCTSREVSPLPVLYVTNFTQGSADKWDGRDMPIGCGMCPAA